MDAIWSSYTACEPGGGSVLSSASLAHDRTLELVCPLTQEAAGPFLRAHRLTNAFVLLLASCAVAFTASGFQDEVFFSLGGGILVWILVLPRLTEDRLADCHTRVHAHAARKPLLLTGACSWLPVLDELRAWSSSTSACRWGLGF